MKNLPEIIEICLLKGLDKDSRQIIKNKMKDQKGMVANAYYEALVKL